MNISCFYRSCRFHIHRLSTDCQLTFYGIFATRKLEKPKNTNTIAGAKANKPAETRKKLYLQRQHFLFKTFQQPSTNFLQIFPLQPTLNNQHTMNNKYKWRATRTKICPVADFVFASFQILSLCISLKTGMMRSAFLKRNFSYN